MLEPIHNLNTTQIVDLIYQALKKDIWKERNAKKCTGDNCNNDNNHFLNDKSK